MVWHQRCMPQSGGEMGWGERERHWGYRWGFACLKSSNDLREDHMSVLLALLEAAFLLRQLQ